MGLRAATSTADFYAFDMKFPGETATRIINEVTGVEEDDSEQMFREWRKLHILSDATIAPPMIGHRAAAVRDNEHEAREILEELRCQESHEGVVSPLI